MRSLWIEVKLILASTQGFLWKVCQQPARGHGFPLTIMAFTMSSDVCTLLSICFRSDIFLRSTFGFILLNAIYLVVYWIVLCMGPGRLLLAVSGGRSGSFTCGFAGRPMSTTGSIGCSLLKVPIPCCRVAKCPTDLKEKKWDTVSQLYSFFCSFCVSLFAVCVRVSWIVWRYCVVTGRACVIKAFWPRTALQNSHHCYNGLLRELTYIFVWKIFFKY